jgi:bifunctional ADP-heptose synthase (sugar kinase/adenylyltransferase)
MVFSDFNYGCLPQPLVDKLIAVCHEHGVMMVADSQISSQLGDVSRFRGMHLLTSTEHEVRVSLQNQDDGLVVLAEKLRSESQATNLVVKLGPEGILLHFKIREGVVETDRLPALNHSPMDPAGAGDALLVATAMTMALGLTPWEASLVGIVAAAIQVSRTGNIPLTQADLIAGMA